MVTVNTSSLDCNLKVHKVNPHMKLAERKTAKKSCDGTCKLKLIKLILYTVNPTCKNIARNDS